MVIEITTRSIPKEKPPYGSMKAVDRVEGPKKDLSHRGTQPSKLPSSRLDHITILLRVECGNRRRCMKVELRTAGAIQIRLLRFPSILCEYLHFRGQPHTWHVYKSLRRFCIATEDLRIHFSTDHAMHTLSAKCHTINVLLIPHAFWFQPTQPFI